MTATFVHAATIHVFFAGREFRVGADALDLPAEATDRALRRALARYLGVDVARLRDHIFYRHRDGDFTLRPRSVFDRLSQEDY